MAAVRCRPEAGIALNSIDPNQNRSPRLKGAIRHLMAHYLICPSRRFEAANGLSAHGRRGCPLWVKSRHMQCKTACPLYPQKRTFVLDHSDDFIERGRTMLTAALSEK